jgi:pimeloyl-ACP methyl ester carboxylesterase
MPDFSRFPFAGHNLFAREGGEGEVLLLIHGFPTSSRDWDRVWPSLAQRFQLLAIDMLGFGQSDKPAGFGYSIAASADQWQLLVESRGISSVRLVAHDYGNTVAQELLARQLEGRLPFRIQSIAFLNGGLFPEATHPLFLQKALLGPLGPLVARLSSERNFVASMRRICALPPDAAELHEHWALLERAGGRYVLPKLIRYIRERARYRERWVGALQGANIPICLVDGIEDPISGATIVRRWRELLPSAPVFELDGVGHYPQWEAPERVLAALEEFYADGRTYLATPTLVTSTGKAKPSA